MNSIIENQIDLKWADEHIPGFKVMREKIIEVKADEKRLKELYLVKKEEK